MHDIQGPSATQQDLSRSLGLPAHKINVHVKRVGGGFGGKEGRFNGLVCGAFNAVAMHPAAD